MRGMVAAAFGDMAPHPLDHEPDAAVLAQTWDEVWSRIARVVHRIREAIAPHLGVPVLDTERPNGSDPRRELRIGRSRLRFEPAPDPTEPALLDVRIVRLHPGVLPEYESTLSIDVVTRSWWSTLPELGPARLRDEDALEKLVFGLLVDRPPPDPGQRASSAGIIPRCTWCGEAGRSRRMAHRGQDTTRSSSTAT